MKRTADGRFMEGLCKRTDEPVFAVDKNGVHECKIHFARTNSRGVVVEYTLYGYETPEIANLSPHSVPRKLVFKDRAEAEKAHFVLRLKEGS